MVFDYKNFTFFADEQESFCQFDSSSIEFNSIDWIVPEQFRIIDTNTFQNFTYLDEALVSEASPSPIDAINWGSVIAGANLDGTLTINYRFQPFEKNFVSIAGIKYDARQ